MIGAAEIKGVAGVVGEKLMAERAWFDGRTAALEARIGALERALGVPSAPRATAPTTGAPALGNTLESIGTGVGRALAERRKEFGAHVATLEERIAWVESVVGVLTEPSPSAPTAGVPH